MAGHDKYENDILKTLQRIAKSLELIERNMRNSLIIKTEEEEQGADSFWVELNKEERQEPK